VLPKEVFKGPNPESERPYLVLARASEEGGVFEGRSNIRRFGGYILIAVDEAAAKQLKSLVTSKERKEAILDGLFEPVKNWGRGNHQDMIGLYKLRDPEGIINILQDQDVPEDIRNLELNPHKASKFTKEYPAARTHSQPKKR
jgi:hypothetical protein